MSRAALFLDGETSSAVWTPCSIVLVQKEAELSELRPCSQYMSQKQGSRWLLR